MFGTNLKWHVGSCTFDEEIPGDEDLPLAHRRQKHLTVVAKTKKRCVELVQQFDRMFNASYMRGYWSTVDNPPTYMRGKPVEEGVWLKVNSTEVRRLWPKGEV